MYVCISYLPVTQLPMSIVAPSTHSVHTPLGHVLQLLGQAVKTFTSLIIIKYITKCFYNTVQSHIWTWTCGAEEVFLIDSETNVSEILNSLISIRQKLKTIQNSARKILARANIYLRHSL